MEKCMVMVFLFGRIRMKNMMANILKVKNMAQEGLSSVPEINIKGSGKMAKWMAKVHFIVLIMKSFQKEFGKMDSTQVS